MHLKSLEKFLALNHIDFEENTGGIMVKLGFLVGRVHVSWDKDKKVFNFNDKARWMTEALVMMLMLYFLIANFSVYSTLQLYTCLGVTIVMTGIFGYKEFKINELKTLINKNVKRS